MATPGLMLEGRSEPPIGDGKPDLPRGGGGRMARIAVHAQNLLSPCEFAEVRSDFAAAMQAASALRRQITRR